MKTYTNAKWIGSNSMHRNDLFPGRAERGGEASFAFSHYNRIRNLCVRFGHMTSYLYSKCKRNLDKSAPVVGRFAFRFICVESFLCVCVCAREIDRWRKEKTHTRHTNTQTQYIFQLETRFFFCSHLKFMWYGIGRYTRRYVFQYIVDFMFSFVCGRFV